MREHHALVWRGLDAWRAEYANAALVTDRLLARGVQMGVEPLPYRLQYALDTTPGFATARLSVDADGVDANGRRWSRRLDLRRDDDGRWELSADGRGAVDLPPPGGDPEAFAEALDCDLGFSPLTNTMPILRLDAEPREHVMAWVSVPDLGVHRSEQRYEPIDERRVRYVGRHRDFVGELELDEFGFVLRYEGLAERVHDYPRPGA
jgi:hypothetical protein